MRPATETVVLVHGLFQNGWEMIPLRRRLAATGYVTFQFTYSTVRLGLEENARALQEFIDRIDTDTLHLVGHSLGGLIIRYLFHASPRQRPGRVVTLGTPHRGSSAAVSLANTVLGRLLLGESFERGLSGQVPAWTNTHELGLIAGSSGIGMGVFVTELSRPHDGTVAVAETYLPNAKDHIILPVSHFGMLLSEEVVCQTCYFLKLGKFDHTRY